MKERVDGPLLGDNGARGGAVKIIADDDVNLGMISSVGKKKRKKGAA